MKEFKTRKKYEEIKINDNIYQLSLLHNHVIKAIKLASEFSENSSPESIYQIFEIIILDNKYEQFIKEEMSMDMLNEILEYYVSIINGDNKGDGEGTPSNWFIWRLW